jgi:hypothetical protein
MTGLELALLLIAAGLLAALAAALAAYRTVRVERDDARDATETMLRGTERTLAVIGQEMEAIVAERRAAEARARNAEARERIANAAWSRAVDKLMAVTSKPVDETPVDWNTPRGRHLVALDRESVLRG